jgi:predicted RNase H-like HicB family nuclease
MTAKEQLIREIEKTPDDHLWQQVLDFALFLQAKNGLIKTAPERGQNNTGNAQKNIYNYTVIFELESDGGYHAFCPTLEGCHSQGDTWGETVANITEAIEVYLESLLADNLPLPTETLTIQPICVSY